MSDNVLLISLDSLRKDVLGAYEDSGTFDYEVSTPTLDAFAERATVFDSHYAGSLPCMPARREWLAGVREFLWRPWGPIESYDTTLAEAARDAGVLTQLITDHFHYFQHGSWGYYEDFNGFDFLRGHEYDAYETKPRDVDREFHGRIADEETDPADGMGFLNRTQYVRNAGDFEGETDFFAPRLFERTADWLDGLDWDRWFCYLDSFDVHEPFHNSAEYASMYTDEDPEDPDLPIWPYYGRVDEGQSALSERELDFVQAQYAGKVTMVDEWLGRIFDVLDEEGLWEETTVIVTSDHGFLLGEYGWMAKNDGPVFDVLANTPLFVWDPDGERNGERVDALTTAVDLYPTILETLGADVPAPNHGVSLRPLLEAETDDHRDYVCYGYWGASLNVTDGEYTYHLPGEAGAPVDCYSTHQMNVTGTFHPMVEKPDAEADELPYAATPVWRLPAESYLQHEEPLLYERSGPFGAKEDRAGEGLDAEERLRVTAAELLAAYDAPEKQFDRLGLERPG
ncbi:sulfatase [Halomicrobium urmianum]|uniref:sulfatase n=1 Tax=Halomicrobium urmianum TaxID=1586233 RepID=UPI001CDA0C59|nr:sulfatase [Halomicrobium urmianum]